VERGAGDAIENYFGPELRDEVHRHHAELFEAFSDVRVAIEELIADGDRLAARLVVSGRHDRGPFAGQPASGERLSWGSFRFYRVDKGRIAETWAMQDRLALMQQLGLVASLGSTVHWADGGKP
jgi:predicted ester cyclase